MLFKLSISLKQRIAIRSDCIMGRILYILTGLDAGGTERQLFLLVKHLVQKGFQCGIATLEVDGKLKSSFLELGIDIFEFGLKKRGLYEKPSIVIGFTKFVVNVIRKYRPHILHSFLPLITMVGTIGGKICRVPGVLISKRGLSTHHRRVPILKWCDILADRLSDMIITNSMAVKEDTLNYSVVDKSKIKVIYNGVELVSEKDYDQTKYYCRSSLGIKESSKVIINIGNLLPYKGHCDLLKAVAIVRKYGFDIILLVIGDDRGTLHNLMKLCNELKIENCVRFLGYREDAIELLGIGDVYVHPSYEEGFSNAILEAMAARLPVIATNVGGNPEAVFDGVNGLLIPPYSPGEIALALKHLLEDTQRAKEMGARGQEIAKERFSVQAMVEAHLNAYFEVLKRKGYAE